MQPVAADRDLAVVIIASRETVETLTATVGAALAAAAGRAVVDVLVNGSSAPALAQALVARLPEPGAGIELRVWALSLGDKAHAWNHYVHVLWPGARSTVFVDGYARVRGDALSRLAAACEAAPEALAATGMPVSGRSAAALRRQMAAEGGLHGNLFMLTLPAMQAIRERGFRLPLGIYRTDSTLGAALAFGLDPSTNDWRPRHFIALAPDAAWDVDTQHWWSWPQLRAQWRRRGRQAQGDLENAAIRALLALAKQPPEHLPSTVEALVLGWASAHPDQADAMLRRSRLRRAAFARLRAGRDWSGAAEPVRRVLTA